jgi:hypothetical protein
LEYGEEMNESRERWLEAVDPEVLRRRRERLGLIVGGLVVFAIVIAVAFELNKTDSGAVSNVYLAAQGAVSSQMTPKGKLRFSTLNETQVTQIAGDSSGPQRFLVRGWVQDVTESGQVETSMFTLVVDRDPVSRTDRVHDMSLVPQN